MGSKRPRGPLWAGYVGYQLNLYGQEENKTLFYSSYGTLFEIQTHFLRAFPYGNVYIVACQAHPPLVKKGPVSVSFSFLYQLVSMYVCQKLQSASVLC